MRGNDEGQAEVFSYLPLEQRIPQTHPLRRIREMADGALRELDVHFEGLYAGRGRPSIAPERLVRGLLLMVLYSIRSERQLMEQIDFNLLYRWFVGLQPDEGVWDATVFTKNRERLMRGEVAERLLEAVVEQARRQGLLSEEHFTVDGTLIRAWASRRSFQEKKDPPHRGSGARGRKLLRDTHESSTDPEARLFKRSASGESVPSYLLHALTENRHGLVVGVCVTQSGQRAEREAGLELLDQMQGKRAARITLGADTNYQEEKFIAGLRQRGVVPHVAEYAPSKNWPNWLRAEEREDPKRERSQRKRKLVEKVFGWVKQDAGLRQVKLRGRRKVNWLLCLAMSALNLMRMRQLTPAV
jgi:transposase